MLLNFAGRTDTVQPHVPLQWLRILDIVDRYHVRRGPFVYPITLSSTRRGTHCWNWGSLPENHGPFSGVW